MKEEAALGHGSDDIARREHRTNLRRAEWRGPGGGTEKQNSKERSKKNKISRSVNEGKDNQTSGPPATVSGPKNRAPWPRDAGFDQKKRRKRERQEKRVKGGGEMAGQTDAHTAKRDQWFATLAKAIEERAGNLLWEKGPKKKCTQPLGPNLRQCEKQKKSIEGTRAKQGRASQRRDRTRGRRE